MTAKPAPDPLSRAALQLTIRTLETRAERSKNVMISGAMARLIVRYLKRLQESGTA